MLILQISPKPSLTAIQFASLAIMISLMFTFNHFSQAIFYFLALNLLFSPLICKGIPSYTSGIKSISSSQRGLLSLYYLKMTPYYMPPIYFLSCAY